MSQGKVVVRQNGALYFMIHLTLMPGRDDDLIAALRDIPRGRIAATAREMLRCGVSSGRFLADDDDNSRQVAMRLDDVGLDI